MTNFAEQLASAAADDPHHPAVKLDDLVLDYGALDAAAASAAGLLRSKGVQPGDRVGMQLPNVPYFPIVYFGALRAGAVVVPMNPLLKGREVAYHLSDSGARVVLGWHQFEEPVREGADEAGAECVLVEPGGFEQLLGAADPMQEVVERADEDPAVIIYTSGTTGTPKGATLMHTNLSAGAKVGQELVERRAREPAEGHRCVAGPRPFDLPISTLWPRSPPATGERRPSLPCLGGRWPRSNPSSAFLGEKRGGIEANPRSDTTFGMGVPAAGDAAPRQLARQQRAGRKTRAQGKSTRCARLTRRQRGRRTRP